MAGMPWVKVYTEILDDVKLSRLTDAQKWRFIQFIIMAGECDAGGDLVTGDTRVTHEEVTWRLRCDSQILENDIKKLVECGLIKDENGVITVIKFGERQGPTQEEKRNAWKKRQETHRNKVKKENVTGESRVSHATEEEKSRVEEEVETTTAITQSSPDWLPLSQAFTDATHIPELTGGPTAFYKALDDMKKAGVLPEDITQAISDMREKGFQIARLASVVNPAIIAMSNRTSGGNGKSTQKVPRHIQAFLEAEANGTTHA